MARAFNSTWSRGDYVSDITRVMVARERDRHHGARHTILPLSTRVCRFCTRRPPWACCGHSTKEGPMRPAHSRSRVTGPRASMVELAPLTGWRVSQSIEVSANCSTRLGLQSTGGDSGSRDDKATNCPAVEQPHSRSMATAHHYDVAHVPLISAGGDGWVGSTVPAQRMGSGAAVCLAAW